MPRWRAAHFNAHCYCHAHSSVQSIGCRAGGGGVGRQETGAEAQRRRGAKERGRRQSRHNKLLGYDLENICQLQVVFVTQKEKEGEKERDRERKCAAEKGISR